MPCLGRVPLEPGRLGGIGLWEPRRELAALLDRRRVWPLWHTPLSSETACRKQWAMQAVGAEAAWDLSVGGRASTAAFAPSSTPGPPQPPSSLPGMAKGLDSGRKSISTDSVTVCVVDSGESQLGRAGAARAARALSCACCPCQGSGPPSTCQPLRWTLRPPFAGIDYTHTELAASLHPLVGTNVINASDSVMDALGHGTHIAGGHGLWGSPGGPPGCSRGRLAAASSRHGSAHQRCLAPALLHPAALHERFDRLPNCVAFQVTGAMREAGPCLRAVDGQ